MSSPEPSLSGRIRVMQIIAAALIFGAASFLVVCVLMVQNNEGKGQAEPPEGALPILSLMALVFLLGQLLIAYYLPAAVLREGVQGLTRSAPDSHVVPPSKSGLGGQVTDTDFLLSLRLTTLIMAMALFEGTAFFSGIAYLVEARPMALVVGGVCVGLLLLLFPGEGRVRAWLDQQRRDLNELRMRNSAKPKEQQ